MLSHGLDYSVFQKELESKLEKTEKDANNLEEKLNKDILLLQSQLENEKVRNLNVNGQIKQFYV